MKHRMKQVTRTTLRALRNVARNPLRAALMVSLLAVGISLALIMFTVDSAFADRLDQIKASVGTDVTVRPAGSSGGPGGFAVALGDDDSQTYLSDEDVAAIANLDHVEFVSRRLTATATETNLEAAIPEGAEFRFSGQTAEGEDPPGPPILTIGTDAVGPLQLMGGGTAEVSQGRGFSEDDRDANVAIVGENLAANNDLQVGDTFELEGETIEVVGLFSSETFFGDNSIFLPIGTTQRLFDHEGEVSEATAQVDSAENVDLVADSIRDTLGEDEVDVTTSEDQYDAISGSLESARSSSRVALIAALIASVAVILFATVLVTRQRVREIGILKAVGASGWHVGLQFGVETLVVALVAAIVGAALTFPTAQAVANGLVSSNNSDGGPISREGSSGEGGTLFIGSAAGRVADAVDVAVTPTVFVYAVILAAVLALVASCVPAWRVSQVRPADVLRYE
jgi:putative ABC transport system permease protein